MRFAFYYSTILLAAVIGSGVGMPVAAQTYAISDPMIIACPSPYKGELTVVETNQTQFPWQILRWNCQGNLGLVQKIELEQYFQKNPPVKGASRRWEEKCPSGSVGNIVFNSYEARRFVESWTCSIDGSTKMSFEELKRMLENKQTLDGASGVIRQHACPSPYQGSYSVVYRTNKWDLQQWTCAAPGTKNRVPELTMRMLISQ